MSRIEARLLVVIGLASMACFLLFSHGIHNHFAFLYRSVTKAVQILIG